MAITDKDLLHLRRCVELAREALKAGDEPFGSVLVDADGKVRTEDRNRTAGGDQTRHPEFELARWAANEMTPEGRAAATVYTSGEHCPMCATAHGWVGLGRIVYASSSAQMADWWRAMDAPAPPINLLPVTDLVPGLQVDGPAPEFEDELHDLHRRFLGRTT